MRVPVEGKSYVAMEIRATKYLTVDLLPAAYLKYTSCHAEYPVPTFTIGVHICIDLNDSIQINTILNRFN